MVVNCSGANIKGCGPAFILYRLNVSRLWCGSRCSCCMLPAVCAVCWLKCRADQRAAGADKKKRAAVVAVPPCISKRKMKGVVVTHENKKAWAQKSSLFLCSLTGLGLRGIYFILSFFIGVLLPEIKNLVGNSLQGAQSMPR